MHPDPLLTLSSLTDPLVLCRRCGPSETHGQTPMLTPLKSESTSESSRTSSTGTFLFFRRCSSRLFWQGFGGGRGRKSERNQGRGWKCSLKQSEILLSWKRAVFLKRCSTHPPKKTSTWRDFDFHLMTNWMSSCRITWRFTFGITRDPSCTHVEWGEGAMQLCVCVCREGDNRSPHIPLACGPCESVVGGDSPALDSCAPRWCASLMTNQPAQWFLQLRAPPPPRRSEPERTSAACCMFPPLPPSARRPGEATPLRLNAG